MASCKWLRENDKEWENNRVKKIISDGLNLYYETNDGLFLGKTHSEETKKKMSESHKDEHNGEKNSQYGTIWIYSTKEK